MCHLSIGILPSNRKGRKQLTSLLFWGNKGIQQGGSLKKSKQLSFLKKVPRHFGGSQLKGNAKVSRPLSSKHPVHLVLRSEHAVGSRSMLRPHNAKKLDHVVRSRAKACGIVIYHLINVGNHLHIIMRVRELELYPQFIRAITGIIARHVLGAERGAPKNTQFWVARPFTRLVSWGRDWDFVTRYMAKNALQARRSSYFVPWGFEVTDLKSITALNTG